MRTRETYSAENLRHWLEIHPQCRCQVRRLELRVPDSCSIDIQSAPWPVLLRRAPEEQRHFMPFGQNRKDE